MPTSSVEDYLKAIYQLSMNSENAISTKVLSDHLGVKSASSTEMFKRLRDKKYITYEPYKGVRLTKTGAQIGAHMVRKHRLWETFLVDKLNFSWDQVHDMAEQLEHTNSKELVLRLDEFLDFPKYDPHGDPIPDENGQIRERHHDRLTTTTPGDKVTIVGVSDHSKEFFELLETMGIALGIEIQVLKVFQYDQSMLVKVGKKELTMSDRICRNLLVKG